MTSPWPLWLSIVVLVLTAAVILLAGTRLTRVADSLAERTGIGDALAGALLLGAVTSLPGIVTTITGSLGGDPGFGLANPVGGVAVQTVWLAIADLVYRRANIEHAAASLENLLQTLILMTLLAIPVVAYATPKLQLGWIHPMTLLIPVAYGYGLYLLRGLQRRPMWRAVQTADTETEEDQPPTSNQPIYRLWWALAALGLLVGAAGWAIGRAGLSLVATTEMPSALVGYTLTTAITSLPELVVLITAVRMGALTLGVGNIIGGNTFDTLMIAMADVFYLEGPVYRDAGDQSLVLLGGTSLMIAVLAGGLLVRDTKGIGFEGLAIPSIYLGSIGLLFATG